MKLFTGFIVSYLPPGQDGASRTACRSPRGSQVLCTPETLTRTLPRRKGGLLHFPQQKSREICLEPPPRSMFVRFLFVSFLTEFDIHSSEKWQPRQPFGSQILMVLGFRPVMTLSEGFAHWKAKCMNRVEREETE